MVMNQNDKIPGKEFQAYIVIYRHPSLRALCTLYAIADFQKWYHLVEPSGTTASGGLYVAFLSISFRHTLSYRHPSLRVLCTLCYLRLPGMVPFCGTCWNQSLRLLICSIYIYQLQACIVIHIGTKDPGTIYTLC